MAAMVTNPGLSCLSLQWSKTPRPSSQVQPSSSRKQRCIPMAFGGLLHQVPSLTLLDSPLSSAPDLAYAVAGGGVVAAVAAAALSLADPEKRRKQQAESLGAADEKEVVRNYFDTAGFERWRRIYGDTEDVNTVQRDIREGHAQTVEKVLSILTQSEEGLRGVSVCDAGCGTGSLAIPMSLSGADVYATDISSAMVSEAERLAKSTIKPNTDNGSNNTAITLPRFEAKDLESLQGKYHTVTCIDVLIHYDPGRVAAMIARLASLADRRLILTFAPKTPLKLVLKRIGELFPGPSKATRAYLHSEADIEAALNSVGWVVRRKDMTSTKFYYSRLFEAVPRSE